MGSKWLRSGLMMPLSHGKKPPSAGARSFMEPTVEEDDQGHVVRSGIYTYGETVHIFVERKKLQGGVSARI